MEFRDWSSGVCSSNLDISALLNFGYSNYQAIYLSDKIELPEVTVALRNEDFVRVKITGETKAVVSKDGIGEIKCITEIEESVTAPVENGQKLGVIKVYMGNELIKTLDIVAETAVERMSLLEIYNNLIRKVLCR